VLGIAATYAPALEDLSGIVADLDTILSLAHVAINAPIPYTRPEIIVADSPAGKVLELKQCRHPCVEVQEGIEFIPNDLVMSHVCTKQTTNSWPQIFSL
jgi:DNA mismatch repair protein MSH2